MLQGHVGLHELAFERVVRRREEAAVERRARTLRIERKVETMSTQDRNEDERLQEWARKRVKQGRSLKLRVAAFVLGMLILTPVWAVGEYLSAGGWPQRLSPNDNPGDWSPWIIWVALAWGFYVALSAVALHLHRPISDREVERELKRLTARRT
ncbi:MAG: 2TM domain-containing protein [Gaiellaceae bacterium]